MYEFNQEIIDAIKNRKDVYARYIGKTEWELVAADKFVEINLRSVYLWEWSVNKPEPRKRWQWVVKNSCGYYFTDKRFESREQVLEYIGRYNEAIEPYLPSEEEF